MKTRVKYFLCLFCAVLLMFSLCACGAEKELCGTWYNDFNGTRNAVQFYKNSDGEYIFIWAVYDIDSDTVTSNTAGKYSVSGSRMTLIGTDSSEELTFTYSLEGDSLTLTGDSADLKLTKYTIDE